MRILQITTKVPYPPKDGGAAAVFMFSKTLVKAGHQVQILAVNPPKHFVRAEVFDALLPGLSIIPVSIDTSPHFLQALKNLLLDTLPYHVERFINRKFGKILIRVIHEFKPDVVQLEGIYLCPYIELVRRHTLASIILRAHNAEHVLWSHISFHERNLLKKFYLRMQASRMKKYESQQMSRIDGLITFTGKDLSILKSLYNPIKSKVIPFGVEDNFSPSRKPVSCDDISFIGALDWIPNQEAIRWFVVDVWPKVHLKFPDLRFHLAGRNAPEDLLRLFGSVTGIVFHGEVNDSIRFLDQYQVMVVPLFSGSGIRVKIIEAMQRGLAVIASTKAVDGIDAIPGKHYLKADSVGDFISAIELLRTDERKRKEISVAARELIRKKFDILAITADLVNFYNEVNNG